MAHGCLLIIILFILYATVAGMTESTGLGLMVVIFVLGLLIYNIWYSNTPEGIEKLKKEHQQIRERGIENATKCSRCKSINISTTWIDTWQTGKIGRNTVYNCNECGFRWQIDHKGYIKIF
jgi:DNA-directed RNA polymerase subunit RPC12/RpoP